MSKQTFYTILLTMKSLGKFCHPDYDSLEFSLNMFQLCGVVSHTKIEVSFFVIGPYQ